MALVLEELIFKTRTEELERARVEIAKLGDAVNSLNRPMQDFARNTAKTAEAIAKSELATEKARVAKEKLSTAVEDTGESMSKTEKYLERLSTSMKIFRGEVLNTQGGTLELGENFTKGQANALAYQLQLGATADQLKAIATEFKALNAFSNTNPFDKSTRGLSSLRQEISELQMVDKFMRDGIALTRDQIVNLAKDSERLTQAYKSMNKSDQELVEALQRLQQETIESARTKNILIEASRQSELQAKKEADALIEQSRAAKLVNDEMMKSWAKNVGVSSPVQQDMSAFYREQAAAADNLEAKQAALILTEQKLAFVNKELAAGLTTASANALFKYQKDLESLGKSTDEITKRTTAFRVGLVEKQGHSPIKKIADDAAAARKEVDHLARALGPQITDIFVGLATGQSPLTILLQQGGQLRDQIALAGIESNKMGQSLTTAASYMVTSIKDVAVAVGQLLAGAFTGAGKKVIEFSTAITGTDKAFAALSTRMPVLISGITTIVGVMGGAFIASVVALGVAFFKVQKNLDDLTKTLILSGGSLGLTSDSAVSLAISMEDVGISSSKAMAAIQAMAKEGGFARSEIQMITQSSVEMQKYLGVAVEDTVKQFAKLKGEPVDALLEVAKTTGMIPPEIIATVMALKDQGKEAEAAALAMKAYSDATVEQVQRAKTEYTDFGRFMIELGSTIASFWDTIKGVVIKASPTQELENLRAEMQRNLDFSFTDTQKKYWSTQLESVNKQILRQQELNSAEEISRQANSEAANITAGNIKLREQYNTQVEKSGTLVTKYQNEIASNIEKINRGDTNSLLLAERNKILKKAISEEEKKIAEARKKDNAEATSAAKKLEDQRKKDMNVFEDIMNKSEGLNKAYNDSVDALTRSVKVGDITQQEYTAAFQALYEQQPGYIKQQQEMKKGVDDLNKSTTDFNNKILESQAATAKEREELANMTAMLGMTEEQQKTYMIEYQKSLKLKQLDIDLEKELRAIRQDPSIADNPYIQYDREQKEIQANAAKRQLVEDQASYEIAKKQTEEFKKVQDDITSIIADALFEGGKKGADSLRIYLKTAFRNYVINVIINPIVGSLMGASGVQGASSSLLGNMGSSLLSNAVTGISGVASAFGTAFSNAALSTVQGWVGMSGTAAQMGTSLANAGYFAGSAVGTTASGIGATIGAYAPYALAAVTALDALGVLDTWGGDPDAFLVQQATGTTQRYTTSTTSRLGTVGFVNGNATIMKNGRLISEYGETEEVSGEFQRAALSTIQALDNAIAANMSEQQIRETSEMLSGWFKKSWSFSGGMLEGWLTSRYELILQSLDSTFGKVKDYQKEGEKLTDTTVRLITNLTTVKNTFDSLGISADLVTAKSATNLADTLGGIDNFSSSMQFFYENFFSEEEKMQRETEGLTKAFAAMNLTVPETKEQFRGLLEGALSSDNLEMSASLMALMRPFNDFIAANEELAESLNETVDAVQQEINRLRGENLTDSIVQGTALRAEFDIMSALARGGDITALAKLPEYSQAIEKNMTDFASSASDVIFARALLAQSLSDTMSSLGGNATIVPTSVSGLAGSTSIATTGAADLTASVSSQGDLVSVLIAEIQGLRAEVRADVSANTKTSKILERANQDGETLSVSVVA